MNSPLLQLLVLAGIAVFLILRLRSVLGTRDGFEKPPVSGPEKAARAAPRRPEFEVIEGRPDEDITDHVPQGSDAADALARMKAADRDFVVGDFLQGARGAYEMILMAFEKGNMEGVRGFLAEDVHESFDEVIREREAQGLTIEAEFVGIREVSLVDATFDTSSRLGEVTVRFVGELTSVVRDANGEIVEGSPTEVRRQKDVWTFARVMGSDDPNWQLVATGE
ncbi:MAG: putative lipid-binding transport protein, Tim44 family [Rhodobacteraceae bacterium HLUCCA24]|nr:MAG: putative lipid-binding transport protein, Tim44 family [Rhodobacteraceae bacterium HLUCCA24]